MTKYKSHIEKSEISTMPNVLFQGRIIVIDTLSDAEKAIKALSSESILGIDTETRPSFKKGVHYNVSLLQISSSDTCFLFRLNRIGMPESVISLLENPEIKKIGLSLHDDYQALAKRKRFTPQGFLDLQKYVTGFGIEEKSLQKIFAIIFGQRISKSQQLTNWDADVLTDKQKLYAATDAWACLSIYNHLQQ
ncbi:MAG: 3'-5' exonuclease domain-containing protein 2 [Bacteroidaceae bacterium]|nr:3'-5' exonuclease domain-containing protein 2 [Bacteroidaceae bacterium]MBQ5730633.1 3'-5' exonuclease domain-containing protein 2 [Bacteroidaceae bacterium]